MILCNSDDFGTLVILQMRWLDVTGKMVKGNAVLVKYKN